MPMNMKMDGDKVLLECNLCHHWFQFGLGIYKGRNITAWDAQICDWCLAANYDGIMPDRHPGLIEHLRRRGIAISLNSKGWLDIPPTSGQSLAMA
jgi:hypothetical protein